MLKFGECNLLFVFFVVNDDNIDVSMVVDDELVVNLVVILVVVFKVEVGVWFVFVGFVESLLIVGLLVVFDLFDIEIWVFVFMFFDVRLLCF